MPPIPIDDTDTIYTLNPSKFLVGREMPPEWSAAPVIAQVVRDQVLNPQTNRDETKTILIFDDSVRDAKNRPYKPLIAGATILKSIAKHYGEYPSQWRGKPVPLVRKIEKDKRSGEQIPVIRVADTLPNVNIRPPAARAPQAPSNPVPAPAAPLDARGEVQKLVMRHAAVFDIGQPGLKALTAAQLAGLSDTLQRADVKNWVNAQLAAHTNSTVAAAPPPPEVPDPDDEPTVYQITCPHCDGPISLSNAARVLGGSDE